MKNSGIVMTILILIGLLWGLGSSSVIKMPTDRALEVLDKKYVSEDLEKEDVERYQSLIRVIQRNQDGLSRGYSTCLIILTGLLASSITLNIHSFIKRKKTTKPRK
jgi:hypothetical protein